MSQHDDNFNRRMIDSLTEKMPYVGKLAKIGLAAIRYVDAIGPGAEMDAYREMRQLIEELEATGNG